MAQYAIAFDLDTVAMRTAGMQPAQITAVYQEVKVALNGCGFTVHAQGSLYHTAVDADRPMIALMRLQQALQQNAPTFCQYVRRAHVFRMEDWSDVTEILGGVQDVEEPTAEEEVAEQDASIGAP